ncbi:MAG: PqqD family protein [Candidatus Acidiferrum sp.]
MVSFSDRVVVPAHVLVRHLDGETVLLNLDTEKYFGLDATGTRMWELATHSSGIETAFATLTDEFEVEPDVLRTHFVELLTQLVENGLLKVVPADVESIPAI